MRVLVLIMAAAWVSSTVAYAPCDYNGIIKSLYTSSECFGLPSSLTVFGKEVTYVAASTDSIPMGLVCTSAVQEDGVNNVEAIYSNGSRILTKFPQRVQFCEDPPYILEYDGAEGIWYRLYVIYNDCGVYAYHRCIETPGYKGSGQPSVAVAAVCGRVNDEDTAAAVRAVKRCADSLGIDNYVDITPCSC